MSLECHFTGTIGVMILAKKRGVISSLSESLEKLKNAGLWLSDSFVSDLCKITGE